MMSMSKVAAVENPFLLQRDAAMLARSWESSFCLSVYMSVCPFVCVCASVTRVLCDKTKEQTADIVIPHERVKYSFLTATVIDRLRTHLPEICAQLDPPLRKTLTSIDFRYVRHLSTGVGVRKL